MRGTTGKQSQTLDTSADDAAALGIPPEQLNAWREAAAAAAREECGGGGLDGDVGHDDGHEDDGVFDVEPENWDAVQLFVACQTQWRTAPMGGGALGLEYTGVEAAMRMMGLPASPALFHQVRALEAHALRALHGLPTPSEGEA